MRAALIAFVIASSTAHAEVNYLSDFGFIVENRIETAASPQQAWRGLTQQVHKWWPSDHTWWGDSAALSIEPQAGGCFCEIAGDKQAEHMRVSYVDPDKHLRMVGGLGPLQGMGMFGALDWSISTNEQQRTVITLTYKVNGINPDGFAGLAPIVDKVQGSQLAVLGAFLDAP